MKQENDDLTASETLSNLMLDSPQRDIKKPRILLADTDRRPYAARLAVVLSEVGCEVTAVCSAYGHPLLHTDAVQRTFRYDALRPKYALVRAIDAVDPDLIVPCDDRAVEHLHDLYASAIRTRATCPQITNLIERSLGSAENYATVSRRYDVLQIAQQEGLRVPRTELITQNDDLHALEARQPFPWVLKADESWGGRGVRVVRSQAEAEPRLRDIGNPFRLSRALKRMIVNRDPFWIVPWWQSHKPAVVVQAFVTGRPANCAVFCWKGRVIAGISVEVVSSDGSTGPATIVRLIQNEEMIQCAERLALRLQMSGFFGLDFVIEEGSNDAYLIEMNPRTTPLCHLQLGKGRDMITALWSELTQQPMTTARCITDNELIAYFPPVSDSKNELLDASYLDVPEGKSEFLAEFVRPWPMRSRLFRLLNYWDQMRNPRNIARQS